MITNLAYALILLVNSTKSGMGYYRRNYGPLLPFWAPGPPALPGLPMASYATANTIWYIHARISLSGARNRKHKKLIKKPAVCPRFLSASWDTHNVIHKSGIMTIVQNHDCTADRGPSHGYRQHTRKCDEACWTRGFIYTCDRTDRHIQGAATKGTP